MNLPLLPSEVRKSTDAWDRFWMATAQHFATKSKDHSHQVGCVIVDEDQGLVAQGWNGFPRGVNDNVAARHERPTKYLYTKHAEENAFLNAARMGAKTKGCTLYVTWFPCANCAGDIVQAGINNVICYDFDPNHERWGENMQHALTILQEGGVNVRVMESL